MVCFFIERLKMIFEVEAAHSFGNKRRKDMQKYP